MPLSLLNPVIVLGIDSNYEEVTAAAETYRSEYVYHEFRRNQAEVRRLTGYTATRSDFINESQQPGVAYITGVGHGNYTTYTGHYGVAVLRVGSYYPAEVRDKIIHLLSCQTARTLGPDTVRNGAAAFLGYNENFIFSWQNPEEFFECDSQIDFVLASGEPVRKAHEACIRRFDSYIEKYQQSGDYRLASLFEMNRDRLRTPVVSTAYGNPDSVIGAKPDQIVRVEEFPNLEIPDNAFFGINHSQSVNKWGCIKAVTVWFKVTHPRVSDLQITLKTPGGRRVILYDRSEQGACLDAKYTSINHPDLESLKGEQIFGDWRLNAADLAGQAVGILNHWGIEFVI